MNITEWQSGRVTGLWPRDDQSMQYAGNPFRNVSVQRYSGSGWTSKGSSLSQHERLESSTCWGGALARHYVCGRMFRRGISLGNLHHGGWLMELLLGLCLQPVMSEKVLYCCIINFLDQPLGFIYIFNNALPAYDLRWLSMTFTPAVSPGNLRWSQITPVPPRHTIAGLVLFSPGWTARVVPRPLSLHKTANLQQQGADTVPNLPASYHCEGDVLAGDLHKLERPEKI